MQSGDTMSISSDYYVCSLDAAKLLDDSAFIYIHSFDGDIGNYRLHMSSFFGGDISQYVPEYILVRNVDDEYITILALKCSMCIPVTLPSFSSHLSHLVDLKWHRKHK